MSLPAFLFHSSQIAIVLQTKKQPILFSLHLKRV